MRTRVKNRVPRDEAILRWRPEELPSLPDIRKEARGGELPTSEGVPKCFNMRRRPLAGSAEVLNEPRPNSGKIETQLSNLDTPYDCLSLSLLISCV